MTKIVIEGVTSESLVAQLAYTQELIEFCAPVRNSLDISSFFFHRVTWDSRHTIICTDPELHMDLAMNLDVINLNLVNRAELAVDPEYLFLSAPNDPISTMQHIFIRHKQWHGCAFFRYHQGYTDNYIFNVTADNHEFRDAHVYAQQALYMFVKHFERNFLPRVNFSNQDMWLELPKGVIIPSEDIATKKRKEQVSNLMKELRQEAMPVHADGIFASLSPRETTCMKYLTMGLTAKGIAQEMGLSFRTVEYYIQNIKDKTGIRYKNDLIRTFRSIQGDLTQDIESALFESIFEDE